MGSRAVELGGQPLALRGRRPLCGVYNLAGVDRHVLAGDLVPATRALEGGSAEVRDARRGVRAGPGAIVISDRLLRPAL